MNAVDRGARREDHLLLTQANRYASALPWLSGAPVYKLVSPRFEPARFSQQLLSLGEGFRPPALLPPGSEQFLYVLSGELQAEVDGSRRELTAGAFEYCPPGTSLRITAASAAGVLRIHRPWTPEDGVEPPAPVAGHRDEGEPEPTRVPGLTRRELLPGGDPSFDFAMSIMSFAPGTGLDQVEIHDEEHGLYMLAGGGRYLLGSDWYDVERDDFIYMAPYCPQTFVAGPEGGEYLLYKDAFRELP